MATAVIFPKVSLETDAGTISRWLKEDGATVSQGEALFEIDNDKAAVEVEERFAARRCYIGVASKIFGNKIADKALALLALRRLRRRRLEGFVFPFGAQIAPAIPGALVPLV